MSALPGSGCLIVIDRWGHVRETIAGRPINGPWDMTSADFGGSADLFVTNVLNGTVAAKGGDRAPGHGRRGSPDHPARPDAVHRPVGHGDRIGLRRAPGPGGAGHRARPGSASPERHAVRGRQAANRIAAIPRRGIPHQHAAGRGATVSQGHALNGPLGLSVAPSGDILTVNGGNGRTRRGRRRAGLQVAVRVARPLRLPAGRRGAVRSGDQASTDVASTSWTTRPTSSTCCIEPSSAVRRAGRTAERTSQGS